MALRSRKIKDELTPKKIYLDEKTKKLRSSFVSAKKSQPKCDKSKEVVIKITSSGKTVKSIKNHIDYISRNGNEKIIDKDGLEMQSNTDRKHLSNQFIDVLESDKRETLNIVFSYHEAKREHLLEAIKNTIDNKYPDNYYAMAVHEDTKNPHCHVILKLENSKGKRINPNKKDLQEFRDNFSKELNKFGYQSKSTNYYSDKDKQHIKQLNNYNQFVIKDYGNAPYQNRSNGKASFFVTYETQKGNEVTLWGKGLKDAVTKNNIEKGDRVSISKQTKQTNTGKINQWQINIVQKHLEKDFNKSMTMRERIKLQQKMNNNPQISKPQIIKTSKLKQTIRQQVDAHQAQKKPNPIELSNEQPKLEEPKLKQTIRQQVEAYQSHKQLNPIEPINEQPKPQESKLKQTVRQKVEAYEAQRKLNPIDPAIEQSKLQAPKLEQTVRQQVETYQIQKKFDPIEPINDQFRPKEPNLKQTVRQQIEAQQKANTLQKQQIEVPPDSLFNEQKQSSLRSALDRIIQSKKDNEKQKRNKKMDRDY